MKHKSVTNRLLLQSHLTTEIVVLTLVLEIVISKIEYNLNIRATSAYFMLHLFDTECITMNKFAHVLF